MSPEWKERLVLVDGMFWRDGGVVALSPEDADLWEITLIARRFMSEFVAESEPAELGCIGVSAAPASPRTVVLVGSAGESFLVDDTSVRADTTSPRSIEKGLIPPQRCVASIGAEVFAVGMGRTVFRRRAGVWQRFDEGLRGRETTETDGFQGIAGWDKQRLIAVGFGGEIWEHDGGIWRQVDSPTNVALDSVACAPGGECVACGKLGTLLVRAGGHWSQMMQDETEDELFSCAWFHDRFYFASMFDVYQLTNAGLARVSREEVDNPTAQRLRVGDDRLWSIGAKDLIAFDGRDWTRFM